jgi:hypothetical protein
MFFASRGFVANGTSSPILAARHLSRPFGDDGAVLAPEETRFLNRYARPRPRALAFGNGQRPGRTAH